MDFQFAELLQSVLIVSGIATFLAVLMVIADATIGNYGIMNLIINKEHKHSVEGGKTLLNTLKEEGVFIPSACGGRGSCGLCKCKVTAGGGDYLPTELTFITKEEQKEGIRLSCQLKVKRDIEIEIPEELFNVKEFRTKVSSIKDLTHDIKEVRLELLDPKEINFTAGQFVQIQVPEYELTNEPVYRAYSVSSDSVIRNSVELEIRYVPNGICTTYVHKYLKEGDVLTITGPYGDFYLRDTNADIVCVAGGSGMAPIKSILHHIAEKKIDRKVTYIFGAQGKRDLFLLDEMKEFEKKIPTFRFVPALSNASPEDKWEGETGKVTEVLAKYLSDGSNTEAYLCGSPGMINAVIEVLKSKGVKEENIYYDKF
ncbi:MAG TPA: 2Fe-2S iron-sulfur cluster binding domain-containing protein [bacterium]|nr:2Fe-2S iron-sulfur cluster binding domain-containing protein [bacterium]